MNEPVWKRSKHDADATDDALIMDNVPTNSSSYGTSSRNLDLKPQKKLRENQNKEIGNKSKLTKPKNRRRILKFMIFY